MIALRHHLMGLLAALLLLGQLVAPAGLMPARAADGAFTYILCTTAGAAQADDTAPSDSPSEPCAWALAAVPAPPQPEAALPLPAAQPALDSAARLAAAGPRGPPPAAPPPARAPPALA